MSWIKAHRSIADSSLWLEEPFSRGQAWMDLLMLTNFKDGYIRVSGERIPIKRGQCGWSKMKLTQRWRWSRGKVDRFLHELEMDGRVSIEQDTRTTVITICNYAKYQDSKDTDSTADETPGDTPDEATDETSDRTTDETTDRTLIKKNQEGKELKELPPNPLPGDLELFPRKSKPGGWRAAPGTVPIARRVRRFTEEFWPIVWWKKSVDDAEAAFVKRGETEEIMSLMISEAVKQGPGIVERGSRPGSTILHPATWINRGDFYDEKPNLFKSATANGNGNHPPITKPNYWKPTTWNPAEFEEPK